MIVQNFLNQWDYWELDEKITVDYDTKLIYVNPEVTELNIRSDVYSALKRFWALDIHRHNYGKYDFPIKLVGGQPTVDGKYLGDVYFLRYGWRMVIDPTETKVTGILYSEDYETAWLMEVDNKLKPLYPQEVSNLVQMVYLTGASITPAAIRVEMDERSSQLKAIRDSLNQIPTAEQNAAAVRNELQIEMNKLLMMESGLTPEQAKMLSEIYALYGLDPTKPLIVSNTNRRAGDINQTIESDATRTIVTRT